MSDQEAPAVELLPVPEDQLPQPLRENLARRREIQEKIRALNAEADAEKQRFEELRKKEMNLEFEADPAEYERRLREAFREVGIGLDPMSMEQPKDFYVSVKHFNPLGGALTVDGIVVRGPRLRLTLRSFNGTISVPIGMRERVEALQEEVRVLESLAASAYELQKRVYDMFDSEAADQIKAACTDVATKYREMRDRRMAPAGDHSRAGEVPTMEMLQALESDSGKL